jgi:hypothetical protein
MKAYEILEKRENWVRGAYAVDAEGGDVLDRWYTSEVSVAFCAQGAICRKYKSVVAPEILLETEKLAQYLRDQGIKPTERVPGIITYWNDYVATHEEVVQVLKELDI